METLDVIVRFHDLSRSAELDRCIFSLVTQDFPGLTITLVTQRFSSESLGQLNRILKPLTDLGSHVKLNLINYSDPEPIDARSAMLNMAISQARCPTFPGKVRAWCRPKMPCSPAGERR